MSFPEKRAVHYLTAWDQTGKMSARHSITTKFLACFAFVQFMVLDIHHVLLIIYLKF